MTEFFVGHARFQHNSGKMTQKGELGTVARFMITGCARPIGQRRLHAGTCSSDPRPVLAHLSAFSAKVASSTCTSSEDIGAISSFIAQA